MFLAQMRSNKDFRLNLNNGRHVVRSTRGVIICSWTMCEGGGGEGREEVGTRFSSQWARHQLRR